MAIKHLKSVPASEELGAPVFIAPLVSYDPVSTPEYQRALTYVTTIARVKNMLIQTVRALPRKSQDAFVKAIKKEISKNDFELPALDFVVCTTTVITKE